MTGSSRWATRHLVHAPLEVGPPFVRHLLVGVRDLPGALLEENRTAIGIIKCSSPITPEPL
jgi:hypothetical protein